MDVLYSVWFVNSMYSKDCLLSYLNRWSEDLLHQFCSGFCTLQHHLFQAGEFVDTLHSLVSACVHMYICTVEFAK